VHATYSIKRQVQTQHFFQRQSAAFFSAAKVPPVCLHVPDLHVMSRNQELVTPEILAIGRIFFGNTATITALPGKVKKKQS